MRTPELFSQNGVNFMMKSSGLLLYLCFTVFTFMSDNGVDSAMSDAQLKAAVKLVRNLCQPKTKATDEDIAKMHAGDWNIDRTAMCYMQCALSRQRLMTKENKLDYDQAIGQAKKQIPESIKVETFDAIEKCKDAAKTLDDSCVAAYEISKCFQQAHPDKYFLP